jgi:hypothetical protein
MKRLTIMVTLFLSLMLVFGTIACGREELAGPTPTLGPSVVPTPIPTPTSTVTPQAVNWGLIAVRLNQLASENGVSIHEVRQWPDDIAEVSVEGECMGFADAIDEEPALELLGEPQLDDRGICTLWFRVLSH